MNAAGTLEALGLEAYLFRIVCVGIPFKNHMGGIHWLGSGDNTFERIYVQKIAG